MYLAGLVFVLQIKYRKDLKSCYGWLPIEVGVRLQARIGSMCFLVTWISEIGYLSPFQVCQEAWLVILNNKSRKTKSIRYYSMCLVLCLLSGYTKSSSSVGSSSHSSKLPCLEHQLLPYRNPFSCPSRQVGLFIVLRWGDQALETWADQTKPRELEVSEPATSKLWLQIQSTFPYNKLTTPPWLQMCSFHPGAKVHI